jgi:hypothetical protein
MAARCRSRREKNLENAMLDGKLTASLQPDDVRVGDVIEVAYTRTRRDPAIGGRAELVLGPPDGFRWATIACACRGPPTARCSGAPGPARCNPG